MKNALTSILCVAGFFVVAAPTAVERPNAVFVNGQLLGNAEVINGVIAISVEDLARFIGGTPNLAEAGLRIQGNALHFVPAVQSPRDAASGLPTGKRMHKPFVITKELAMATPLLYDRARRQFVPLTILGTAFSGPVTVNANTLQPGQAIHLNFAPNPNAPLQASR